MIIIDHYIMIIKHGGYGLGKWHNLGFLPNSLEENRCETKEHSDLNYSSGHGEVKPNEDWRKEGINQQKQEHISRMVQYPSWNRLMVSFVSIFGMSNHQVFPGQYVVDIQYAKCCPQRPQPYILCIVTIYNNSKKRHKSFDSSLI